MSIFHNRRVVLASRPAGAPKSDDFRLEEIGQAAPRDGEVLVKQQWLSIDPYMRMRISAEPSYAEPLGIDELMVGGTVGRVVQSRHPDFREGDLVAGSGGWQEYALSDGSALMKLDDRFPRASYALSVLGMPGFTAWHGLTTIGEPQAGETVVVAAASGPVGAIVGQIAKAKGCRVVGVAGGEEKCRHVVDELGFDACLDRRDPDFARKLALVAPQGIDVYFENVGGNVFDAVLPLLNDHARMPVCGLIAHYNGTDTTGRADRVPQMMRAILMKRLRVQGFIIADHFGPRFDAFLEEMSEWVANGQVKLREDIVVGLENAPRALIGQLEGENFGKLVVKLTND
jgi:NADPH-dependent curcumin reductase